MGCVQSSQTRRSARAKQARRQKLYEQQNFHPKPTKNNSSPVKVNEDALTPREIGKTASVHKGRVASPSTPQTPGNGNSGGINSEEIQFRRQHFDRNSMLRHSKKRRKSSASNTASPNVAVDHNKSLPGGVTPNRLKFEELSDTKNPSAERVLSSSTGVGTASQSANNITTLTSTTSAAKNEDSKQRIPNSTSPDHLQRQNSGRLI